MAGSAAASAAAAAATTVSPAPSCIYADPHNDKSCSNTEKQFSVLIVACCNLLFLEEVEINCLWVGLPNPDHLSLASALPWASNWPRQGHNLFELKAQKIVLLKSLFATSHFSSTVYCHWWYDSISQYGHVCHTYSTRKCLPRMHDLLKLAQAPLGQNRQHLQFEMLQLAVFLIRIEWPVEPRPHVLFSFATFGKNACIVQYIPNSLSSWLGIFQSTRLDAKHLNQDFTPLILFEEEFCFLFRYIGASVIRQVKSGDIINHIRWVLLGMQQLLMSLSVIVRRTKLHQQITFQSVPDQRLQVITLSWKPCVSLVSEKCFYISNLLIAAPQVHQIVVVIQCIYKVLHTVPISLAYNGLQWLYFYTFWQVCWNWSTHLHLLQLYSEPDHLGFQFRNSFFYHFTK